MHQANPALMVTLRSEVADVLVTFEAKTT